MEDYFDTFIAYIKFTLTTLGYICTTMVFIGMVVFVFVLIKIFIKEWKEYDKNKINKQT